MELASLIEFSYMAACIFFILGIKKLGKTETARQGNTLSWIGMTIAVVACIFTPDFLETAKEPLLDNGYFWSAIAVLLGTLVGTVWAKKVKMTGMPELVALFNGFGGLSSLLVAGAEYLRGDTTGAWTMLSLALAMLIGAITFSGSVLAWGKLSERISGKPKSFPGQHFFNALLLILMLVAVAGYIFCPHEAVQNGSIITISALALILGVTGVMPIGGGDMPVVISLLNSLSGVAAAMAGFAINNTVLVVAGCLVGASGVILTIIMCKAMNRSIGNLLFSGFGADANGKSAAKGGVYVEPKSASVDDAYLVLEAAHSVVFIPGYGMAVAQAQHAVKELASKLEENGAEVSFAIHPVAGRMPGHMNVLLAEADVPYEQLKTMDEINPIMAMQDVAIVIGANDVVNPAAATDPTSPIFGMPIIKANECRTVFVLKRGKGKGFSGIENELFTLPNTRMIYGDAKATVTALAAEFGKE